MSVLVWSGALSSPSLARIAGSDAPRDELPAGGFLFFSNGALCLLGLTLWWRWGNELEGPRRARIERFPTRDRAVALFASTTCSILLLALATHDTPFTIREALGILACQVALLVAWAIGFIRRRRVRHRKAYAAGLDEEDTRVDVVELERRGREAMGKLGWWWGLYARVAIRPLLIFVIALWLVLGFGLLYSYVGFYELDNSAGGQYCLRSIDDNGIGVLAKGLYLSAVTATTLGYGDCQPSGIGRVFACVEATLGYMILGVTLAVVSARMSGDEAIQDYFRWQFSTKSR
ncbi:MAG: two pore domain potassium channel family protein [Myxococcales bacterium]|nr:two pore domain potassium channel family protein [Myxococcales bacterium]